MYDRFYAGGFRSMRGFSFRGVGPHVGEYNVGGNFAFMNSLEYQIPVVPSDALYVVGFIDSGTVNRTSSLADYRVTAGVGLRKQRVEVRQGAERGVDVAVVADVVAVIGHGGAEDR